MTLYLERVAEIDAELGDILGHTPDKVLQDRSSKENMARCSPSSQLGNTARLKLKRLKSKLEEYRRLLCSDASLSSPVASQSASLNKAFVQSGTLGIESKDLSTSQCQRSVTPLNESQLRQYFGSNYSLMSITQREKILYSIINKSMNCEVPGHDVGIDEVMNISRLASVKVASARNNSQVKSVDGTKKEADLSQVLSTHNIECQQSALIELQEDANEQLLEDERIDDTLDISFKDNMCEQQVIAENKEDTLQAINEAIDFSHPLPKNAIESLEISAIAPLESPTGNRLKEIIKKSAKRVEVISGKKVGSGLVKELAKMSKSLGDASEEIPANYSSQPAQDKLLASKKKVSVAPKKHKEANQTFTVTKGKNADTLVETQDDGKAKNIKLKLLKCRAASQASKNTEKSLPPGNPAASKKLKGHAVFSVNKKKRKNDAQQTPKFTGKAERIKFTNNSLIEKGTLRDYGGKCSGKGERKLQCNKRAEAKRRVAKSVKPIKMPSSKRVKKIQNSSMLAKVGACQPAINLKRVIKLQ